MASCRLSSDFVPRGFNFRNPRPDRTLRGMKWKTILFALFLARIAFAQGPGSPPSGPQPPPSPPPDLHNIWRCDTSAGTYEVLIRAMVSVSRHEYVVDNTTRVSEVNVDTQGNMAVRFYYIEPNTPKAPLGVGQSTLDRVSDLAKEAAQRTGADDAWKRVIKSYPATTHAHTIEYRVDGDDQLKKVFESAQRSFETQRGETLKLN